MPCVVSTKVGDRITVFQDYETVRKMLASGWDGTAALNENLSRTRLYIPLERIVSVEPVGAGPPPPPQPPPRKEST